VHVYEKPAAAPAPAQPTYNSAQAKSSNLINLDQWNPSNGGTAAVAKASQAASKAQARVDDLQTSSSQTSLSTKVSTAPAKAAGSNPNKARQVQQVQPVSARRSDDGSAVVSAKVSVSTSDNSDKVSSKVSASTGEVLKRGTVEDIDPKNR